MSGWALLYGWQTELSLAGRMGITMWVREGGKEESCHEGRVECAGIPHISYQGICARLGGCES